jgi:hypothetical protein
MDYDAIAKKYGGDTLFPVDFGRRVVWCCRKDEMEKTHFGHVVWEILRIFASS